MSNVSLFLLSIFIANVFCRFQNDLGANENLAYAPNQYRTSSNSVDRYDGIPDLSNTTILQIQHGLESGFFNSQDLVRTYLKRIEEVNHVVNAVIETAPKDILLSEAKRLDKERAHKHVRGSLHGIPLLIKDNIATDASLGLNTTAGSYSLLNSIPPMDSPIIAKLREKGAIILGKSNMSVWAQDRGNLTQGWSPRGGYTSSAYYPQGNPCSSSSGSGVSASIGLAAATLGTETDGSIICPSSRNGVVGIKPTVGFASRFGIVPISSTQDSPGPIVQNVDDAAIVLTSMFTPHNEYQEKLDSATASQPKHIRNKIDYAQNLFKANLPGKKRPLSGIRIGSTSGLFLNATYNKFDPEVNKIYHSALKVLEDGGATLVDITFQGNNESWVAEANDAESLLLSFEQQYTLNEYLSFLKDIPSGCPNFGAIIEFANQNPKLELPGPETDQSTFLASLQTSYFEPQRPATKSLGHDRKVNRTYVEAIHANQNLARILDDTLKTNDIEALVAPSDSFLYSLAAKAGFPAITVPTGFLRNNGSNVPPMEGTRPIWPFPGAPVGLNFVSSKWSEETLLYIAKGYEVVLQRNGVGRYDGKLRTRREATPTTQIKDVQLRSHQRCS